MFLDKNSRLGEAPLMTLTLTYIGKVMILSNFQKGAVARYLLKIIN